VAEHSTWGGGSPRRTNVSNFLFGGIGLFLAATLVGTVLGWLNADRANATFPASDSSITTEPSTDPPSTPSPTPTEPDPSETPSAPAPTPSEQTKAELEQQAYSALEEQAATDLQRTNLRGQWVAQLSSKYVGVRDPLQKTRSGSPRFYAVDILAEHQDLRYRFDGQYDVMLLRGQDFNPGTTYNGETLWYTFLLGDFESRRSVDSFCRSAFPGLSGEYLKNHCLPRTLKP
jgi:hypothetical protein